MIKKRSSAGLTTVLALTAVLGVLVDSALFVATNGLLVLFLPLPIIPFLVAYVWVNWFVSTGRLKKLPIKEAMLTVAFLTPIAACVPYYSSVLEMHVRAYFVRPPSILQHETVLSVKAQPIGGSTTGPAVVYTVEDYNGLREERIGIAPLSPYLILIALGLLAMKISRESE